MERLLYISAAARQIGDDDIADILSASRRNNAAVDVTGLLLHVDGGFLQVLEGPREAVLQTYERIGRDPRHSQVITLWREPAETRLFADWSMGFDRLDADDARWDGAFRLDPRKQPETIAPEAGPELLTLMRSFYEANSPRAESRRTA